MTDSPFSLYVTPLTGYLELLYQRYEGVSTENQRKKVPKKGCIFAYFSAQKIPVGFQKRG
jgi:hypothetical protein